MCENSKKKARSITMTTGSLWRNIFLFSIPLMCSQLLEVIFNLSDVAVVGRFADYKALGAVGSTTLLVTLFVGFLIGMGSGVNVRVAHALGSGDRQVTENTIHSALLLCALMGLLVGAVCFFFSGGMLKLLNTKDDLIGQASLYLKIYAVGLPAMGVYNFGNGVLSARGYETPALLSGCSRCSECYFEPVFCHRITYDSRGCCHSYCDRTVCFCRSDHDASASPQG